MEGGDTMLRIALADDDSSFDACFLDIEKPDMDGITLARRIRERDDRLFLVMAIDRALWGNSLFISWMSLPAPWIPSVNTR